MAHTPEETRELYFKLLMSTDMPIGIAGYVYKDKNGFIQIGKGLFLELRSNTPTVNKSITAMKKIEASDGFMFWTNSEESRQFFRENYKIIGETLALSLGVLHVDSLNKGGHPVDDPFKKLIAKIADFIGARSYGHNNKGFAHFKSTDFGDVEIRLNDKMAKYTIKHGQDVLFFIKKTISPKAILIGSLGKGQESDHDIDIHIPLKRTNRLISLIADRVEAKSYEYTDWGGVYFKDTHFGDIDVFFKGNTDEFDH